MNSPASGNSVLVRIAALVFLTLTIAACGGGGSGGYDDDNGDSSVPPAPVNGIPLANAGADQSVGEGQAVVLAGEGSDPDGDPLSYSWVQTSGVTVQLSGAGSSDALFDAPATEVDLSLAFRLTVTDINGGASSDDVLIQVSNDDPPIADAGANQTVNEQSPVNLDGTASVDADGAIAAFLWAQVAGPTALLDDPANSQPSFTAPVVSETEILMFELTVTDETGDTDVDSVNVTVLPLATEPVPADANRFLAFINRSSPLFQETQETADAYYAAIDPRESKTTLDAWKTANGFDLGNDARAVYRNAADLGFGRVMSIRTSDDGSVAAYVENYETLEIAVAAEEQGTRDGLLATVAMEYSTHPDDPGGAKYVKFYTFDGNDDRVTKIDLDGRGEKFQPGLCLVCHGGQPSQLAGGVYPDNGYTDAQFLPWDVDTFEFSDNPLYTRAALEDQFRALNLAALSTYVDPLEAVDGRWSGNSSRELIEGWYGDDGANLPAETFNGQFVPVGWRTPENGGPAGNPADVEELYLKVVAPNCRACHIQRGRSYEGRQEGELIDFTTYARFADFEDQIVDLVFDHGVMPNASVTFDNFWSSKDGVVAAELLGVHFGLNATVRRPGRPIANPGPSREAPIGDVELSGEASLFAETYAWSFANANGRPVNSNASIIGEGNERPILNTDVAGAYNIQLVVSDGVVESEPAITTVVVFDAVDAMSFADDIAPIFSGDCQTCHSVGLDTSIDGIEARFDESATLYSNVIPYVNLENVAASPIITKPTGNQHGAGPLPREGFDLAGGLANKDNYDALVQWISEGAENN